MQNFITFDPCQVSVIFNGAIISGFAENDFVDVAFESENMFTDFCSTDGQVTRIKNSDRRGTVTIKLNKTSASNKVMSVMAKDTAPFLESFTNSEKIALLKKISPVAWQNIHLLGHYLFRTNKTKLDLDTMIENILANGFK